MNLNTDFSATAEVKELRDNYMGAKALISRVIVGAKAL